MILRKLKRLVQHGTRDNYFLQIADTKKGFRIYIKSHQARGSSVELTVEQATDVAKYINTRLKEQPNDQ